ncbi:hypothetical protein BZG36_01171 [Bifiguratus adelaidae]|uniref:Uncharacterized protein n=1 Tax=Bifiguratus adelaidae TaxID=1938954 RepID=A0A261Y5N7_9FUNG|nr:hypothetical protein BZG36_01171 [Bifiguratus adelaidae]
MQVSFSAPRAAPPVTVHHGDMDMDTDQTHIVTPGESITSDMQYMRGHGTRLDESSDPPILTSTLAGHVSRVNKLVSVKPLKARYTGDIGDIVVGRIVDVGQKRWKVDIGSKGDAVLQLSSINLPGGVQRRKLESDEKQMRTFFAEGDVLVAEVQSFFADGVCNLHTRSLNFCKLRNGSFVVVPPRLIQRTRSHFHSLPCGVDVILGLNGYVWVSKTVRKGGRHNETKVGLDEDAVDAEMVYSNKNEASAINKDERLAVARVCNCIAALAHEFKYINDTIIVYAYEASLAYPDVQDLLKLNVMEHITREAYEQMKNA